MRQSGSSGLAETAHAQWGALRTRNSWQPIELPKINLE
jgi:hypothetical protein